MDLAGQEHWDAVWNQQRSFPRVHRANYHHRRLGRILARWADRGADVLDVGCAGSRWLLYCQRKLQCETWGIDYSHSGVRLARSLVGPGAASRILEGDFFDPALLQPASFDFIYSLGVIEHFDDGRIMTRRLAQLLRPRGVVLTAVPNFTGAYGRAQRFFDPERLAKHVILKPGELDQLHLDAGLALEVPAAFWGCFGPAMVYYGPRLQPLFLLGARILQQLVCNGLAAIGCDRESATWSPQIMGIYCKP